MILSSPAASPFVVFPLHKGSEGFMSEEQYKKFYWPTLKELIMVFIESSRVPCLFLAGENAARLEILKDIPKGKALYHFDRVDIRKAKAILGKTVAFQGNVPISLLATATPEQVKKYVKILIDVVGKSDGLIVDSGSVINEAKYKNIKVMIDFTKEYGVY
jgi:uroporphyrinogen-III decarboxylase